MSTLGARCARMDGQRQHRIIVNHPYVPPVVDRGGEEHGTQCTRTGGEGGIHGRQACHSAQVRAGNRQDTTGIEPVPAKPKTKRAEELQCDGMGRKIVGDFQPVAIAIVEAAPAGS